jgi:hypothetical protein
VLVADAALVVWAVLRMRARNGPVSAWHPRAIPSDLSFRPHREVPVTETTGMGRANEAIDLHLTPKEVDLLRTGLEMLEDTFGHEEADELEEVQALLAKLRRQGSSELAKP